MRIKKHENLTKTNISKVIELLNPEGEAKPITKKEACSILNIAYNTKRLDTIIQEHLDDIERVSRMKAKLRGTPASDDEIKWVIRGYLGGENVSEIASRMYRSPAFVKAIIEKIGVPMKLADSDYEGIRSAMLPEQCVAEEFEEGELVWAIRKNSIAKIKYEITVEHQKNNAGYSGYHDPSKLVNYEEVYGAKMYRIDVIEKGDFSNTFFPHIEYGVRHSTQLAYDLGSLRHLEKYGVNLFDI